MDADAEMAKQFPYSEMACCRLRLSSRQLRGFVDMTIQFEIIQPDLNFGHTRLFISCSVMLSRSAICFTS